MLRKMRGHQKWRDLGLDGVTGFPHIPNQKDLETLSKRDASHVIDILLKAGYGFGPRYADELDSV